jgi:large subunit ribosomal protein L19
LRAELTNLYITVDVNQYEKQEVSQRIRGRIMEEFQVGDTVSMQYRQSLRDPKEKPILVEGVVIAIRRRGLGSSFTLVNKFGEHVVERSYPMYSPFIRSLVVLQSRELRRSKGYYLKSLISRD